MFTTLRGNRLILNGNNYTCQDLDTVTQDVHLRKIAASFNGTALVFDGSTSSHHVSSNFYNVKEGFVYEHQLYRSAEQGYQHKKVLLTGDQNKQREIMWYPDPVVQKMLVQKVKGHDRAIWDTQKRTVMKDI